MTSQAESRAAYARTLRFIARLWLRRPLATAATIFLIGLSVAFDLAIPIASGHLVQALTVTPRQLDAAVTAWASFLLLFLFLHICRNGGLAFWNPMAARNMEDALNRGFQKVQSFTSEWHANSLAGSTVRKLSRGMWGYDMASDAIIVSLLPAVLFLLGLAAIMAIRWPLAGLLVIVISAIYVVSNLLLNARWIQLAHNRSVELDSEVGGMLGDAIACSSTVKAFGTEAREEQRVATVVRQWRMAAATTTIRFNAFNFIQNIILLVLQVAVTGLALLGWRNGTASVGDFVFVLMATGIMNSYLRNIADHIRLAQRGLGEAADLAQFMEMEPEVQDAPGAQPLPNPRGEIVFKDVRFRYSGTQEPLFDGLSISIPPGECIAVVGPTGSGKSTFVKLLQRLHDVQDGSIQIEGRDVRGLRLQSLRQAIALVPQDPILFHRSIAENISYSRSDATHEEVRDAAKRARIHDFITSLTNGYDTLVGDRGIKLSGGERQRIAIARAFLSRSPILIFDEATSSLDSHTEKLVQEALDELRVGRTTIIIAHRLSTVRSADRILVFDDGRIVEDGDHLELMRAGGVYARLFNVASESLSVHS